MTFIASNADWDALLQEQYVQKGIISAVNISTPFRDKLRRDGRLSGRERLAPVKVGFSVGQGARAEGAQMPPYGAGMYQDMTIRAKYNYAPVLITGQAEEFSNANAFVKFGTQLVKDAMEGIKLFTGRQCWGDGQGIMNIVNGAILAGTTTVTVDSPYGVLWGSLSTNTTFLIQQGMTLQFGTEDNGGLGYVVQTVGATSFTFLPPLASNVADNTNITTLGSANMEIEGILIAGATAAFMTTNGLPSTVYHGIDRAKWPQWEGNVLNINATLSLAAIRTLRDAIYKRTDDEESNLFICSTEMVRDYEALLVPAQRFVPATKLEGGHTIIEHDGLRISKDSRAPTRAIFLMDTKTIAWGQTQEPHWKKQGGAIFRVIPRSDTSEGLLLWYSNLDFEQPRRVGIGYNVTTS